MSVGIQHLLKGNQNREGRVDKIETDRFNSIVEKISGVNPSKLAAEVTKAKVEFAEPGVAQPPQSSMATWGAGPAHQLVSQRPDSQVNFLAEKVAMLEGRLAKYETFNGQDNDVVQTTPYSRKSEVATGRSAEASAMGSNVIRKKNAKTKDVDGKPDAPPTQNQSEAQMAGEHVNILGISMNEWREMTGIKTPPIDLTARHQVESYEDEDDVQVTEGSMTEHQLWATFLEGYDATPDDFAAFVDEADESEDVEALVAVQELEDEFQEAFAFYMEGDAAAKETIADFLKRGGSVKKLPLRGKPKAQTVGVRGGPATQFGHQEPKKAIADDPVNKYRRQGVKVAAGKAEDVEALWSQWLEERGLSVEMFDNLVEAIETEEDLESLESLQAMFEAELAEMKVGDSVAVNSILTDKTRIKRADNSAGTAHPLIKKMAALRKMAQPKTDQTTEDDEAFECDDDGNGHPDMNGKDWAAAMKKMKKKHRKSGGKS